jgi:hypothetical protein
MSPLYWLLMVQLSPVHHLPWAIAASSAFHWATAIAQVKIEALKL